MKNHVQQLMNRCKHFTGIQHERCAVGIDYKAVRDESQRPYRLPCTRPGECSTTCATAEYPTREEAEAEDRQITQDIENMCVAREAIVGHIEASGHATGDIPCPICESGRVRYTRASNGHIWAQCTTRECVAWIE